MKKVRAMIDGASGKPSTKSGHISDVEFEPQAPALADDEPPNEQIELDAMNDEINRARPMMIPTSSGQLKDRLDAFINKRLDERIRQLQMIRAQITDIQLRNKRDLLAKQIEVNKIVDKLRRTRDRLELVTDELREERAEDLVNPRETRCVSASLTSHVKRSGLMTVAFEDVYGLADERWSDTEKLLSNDDGSYWGIGVAKNPEDLLHIPPRTVFEAGKHDIKRYREMEWNHEFQTQVAKTLSRNWETKFSSLRSLSDMQDHFVETAINLTRIIVAELHVPYQFKSLKPTALPKRRKTRSEFDANDVLKQHTFKADEWEPVYVFNNMMLQVAMYEAHFYDGENAAQKALSNELKAIRFVSKDAIEQGMHFPFSVTIDYAGHRVLATALLPAMADLKDMVDVNKRTREQTDNEELTEHDWDDFQKQIIMRISRLAQSLNLKEHVITFDEQTENIAVAADVQIFVGNDRRNYMMGLMRALPAQPPVYPLQGPCEHLVKLFRPEMVAQSIRPLNADAFSAFVGADGLKDNEECRNLFNTLRKNIIPKLASFLDEHADDSPDLQFHIAQQMHRHGINLRFMGMIGRHCKSARIVKMIVGEMIARCLKVELRSRWRRNLRSGKSSASELILTVVIFLNEMLSTKPEGEGFWKETIGNLMTKKFAGCPALQGGYSSWKGACDLKFVISRMCSMCLLQARGDLVDIFKRREAIVAADFESFAPVVKTTDVVPSGCTKGVQLVCDSRLTENDTTIKHILMQARGEFENALRRLPNHPGVLSLCGDVCLMLSKYFLFFAAREVLEKAEDYYRKALSLRPQWKEILHRLGDVHCEQAKYTRVPETAQRMRVRGGARYLQALCFEWELNYAIKKQKTHKLDHLLQLPRGDIAAISMATKAFTEFENIDLSGAVEISAGGIRRALGKKSVLTSLNSNGCTNFKDTVLSYVCSRAHRTLTSLNCGNCLAIGTEGMMGLSRNCEKLRTLVLDGCVGVEDVGLSEAFKNLTALTHLSMKGLPRVTNKSGVFIGKYIHQLIYLDMSETTQVTGTIINEVAQLCPNFKVGKVDGCYTVDDVPCITLGRCNETLEEISLGDCVRLTSLAIKGLSRCRKIFSVNLSGCFRIDDMAVNILSEKHSFPQLTHVDLTGCDRLTSEAILTLLHLKPWLKRLLIGRVTQMSELVVNRIGKVCRQLEELSLDSCIGVTKEGAKLVAANCTKLHYLSLANCPLVEDTVLDTVALKARSLRKLDLSGCRQISDEALIGVIAKNSKLEELLLYGCPKIGNGTLEALGAHCPLLKSIEISLSNSVTDHGVMKLVTGCPLLRGLHITNCPVVSDDIKDLIKNQLPWIQASF